MIICAIVFIISCLFVFDVDQFFFLSNSEKAGQVQGRFIRDAIDVQRAAQSRLEETCK